jgi:hypothetical protein
MTYAFTRTGPEIEAIHDTVSSLPESISGYSSLTFENIANLKSGKLNDGKLIDLSSLNDGSRVEWLGYYDRSDGGSNWGVLRFGSHSDDGFSIFSIDANTYIEANLKGKSINAAKGGMKVGTLDTDDTTDRIQIVHDYAQTSNQKVVYPSGQFMVDELKIYAFMNLEGQGSGKTIFKGLSTTQNVLIQGGQANMLDTQMKGFTVSGGVTGIDFNVTSSVNNLTMTDIVITGQSQVCAKMFQPLICTFKRVWFFQASGGLLWTGAFANANHFYDCHFVACSEYYFKSTCTYMEANTFNGSRFEGNNGVIPPDEETQQHHIQVIQPRGLEFKGCYFERTHLNTFKETNSTNTTVFSACHFTGAYGNPTGFRRQRMETDGIVEYSGCNAGAGTTFRDGEGRCLLTGSNRNMFADDAKFTEYSGYSGNGLDSGSEGTGSGTTRVVSKISTQFPPGNIRNIFKFSRVTIDASSDNQPVMSGEVTVQFACRVAGGFSSLITQRYQVLVSGVGTAAMTLQFNKIGETGGLTGGVTLDLATTGAVKGEIILQAVFSGSITPVNTPQFQWSFDGISTRSDSEDMIIVDPL